MQQFIYIISLAISVLFSHSSILAADKPKCPFGGIFGDEIVEPTFLFKYPSGRTLGVCGFVLASDSSYSVEEFRALEKQGIKLLRGFTIEDFGRGPKNTLSREDGVIELWSEVDVAQIKVDPKRGIVRIETQDWLKKNRPLFEQSYACDERKCYKQDLKCSSSNFVSNPFPGIVKAAKESMKKGRSGKDWDVLGKLADQAWGGDREAFDLIMSEDFSAKLGYENGDNISRLREKILKSKELGCIKLP